VPNHLWRNDGDWQFRETALETGSAVGDNGKSQASMGLDAQDYDGDGWVDLVFTNFARESNALLRNLGERGLFVDVAFVAGLGASTIRHLAWGVEFHDLDNDSDLDLFIVNGHVYPGAGAEGDGGWRQRNQIFLQDDGRFEDVTSAAGPAMQVRRVGRGAAFGDVDNDGDIDVLLTNLDEEPTLLMNVGARGHWLEIDLEGVASNRDGRGARVRARLADGTTVVREAHGGSSYLSGTSRVIHLGLGDATVVEELEILWPSGAHSHLEGVAVDRRLTIREGDAEVSSEEVRR